MSHAAGQAGGGGGGLAPSPAKSPAGAGGPTGALPSPERAAAASKEMEANQGQEQLTPTAQDQREYHADEVYLSDLNLKDVLRSFARRNLPCDCFAGEAPNSLSGSLDRMTCCRVIRATSVTTNL